MITITHFHMHAPFIVSAKSPPAMRINYTDVDANGRESASHVETTEDEGSLIATRHLLPGGTTGGLLGTLQQIVQARFDAVPDLSAVIDRVAAADAAETRLREAKEAAAELDAQIATNQVALDAQRAELAAVGIATVETVKAESP